MREEWDDWGLGGEGGGVCLSVRCFDHFHVSAWKICGPRPQGAEAPPEKLVDALKGLSEVTPVPKGIHHTQWGPTGSLRATATSDDTTSPMREGGMALLNSGMMLMMPAHSPG